LSQLTAATLSYAAVCAIADSSSFCQMLEIFESIRSQHAISLSSALPDAFEDFF
jgi:hypothetical protein